MNDRKNDTIFLFFFGVSFDFSSDISQKFPIFLGRPLSKTIIIFERLVLVTAINYYAHFPHCKWGELKKVLLLERKVIVIHIIFNPLSPNAGRPITPPDFPENNFPLTPSADVRHIFFIIYLPRGWRVRVSNFDVCFLNLSSRTWHFGMRMCWYGPHRRHINKIDIDYFREGFFAASIVIAERKKLHENMSNISGFTKLWLTFYSATKRKRQRMKEKKKTWKMKGDVGHIT